MAETITLRVALLARPGAASERLLEALREAGADVVLVVDPTQGGPQELAGAGAQAVLVALEPAIEDALEPFDAELSDPAVTVIYEEVELAASRAGWDAARWVRHLAAKLHRHDDVLPPGTESEPEFDLEAGRLSLYRAPEAEGDLSGITGEAEGLAPEVPRDGFGGLSAPAARIESLPAQSDAIAAGAGAMGGGPIDAPFEMPPGVEDTHVGGEPPQSQDALDDAATSARFHQDLADLHQRISGLELVDGPREIAAEATGAVAIVAGLGGPDAVRQLLGAIPEAFPRPVLVQQRLDGARHDKLVRQMQRATAMPVALAEAGQSPQGGHVYILPGGIGVVAGDGGLRFAEVADEAAFAALPAGDSALILLSGCDPAMVDAAMALSLRGALVAGQSPDGCYDASAAQALVARGADSGAPSVLARKLAARWPA